jgi:hypothetical protein
MKALIACEYSRIVADQFEALGWDVTSCDILPAEKEGKHYQGDVYDILYTEEFDLCIGFPPCTFLTYAGTAKWNDIDRVMNRIKGAKFFMDLYNAPIKYVCIENPRGIMTQLFRKPDMEIHPWYFGDREMKRTNLWLKNLPILKYQIQPDLFSSIQTATEKPEPIQIQIRRKTGKIKKRYRCDATNISTFKNGHERSRFYPGIAKAMAEKWTEYIKLQNETCKSIDLK